MAEPFRHPTAQRATRLIADSMRRVAESRWRITQSAVRFVRARRLVREQGLPPGSTTDRPRDR